MQKKLVFNWYLNNDTIDCKVNAIHLKCLEYYKNVFDEIVFILSVDDTNNLELIRKMENKLLGLHQRGNITFKISQNNEYRESQGFKNEVIDRLGMDDLVFFGHNKGITNVVTYDETTIYEWIFAMYYFNLNFIDEVEDKFINTKQISYGALLTKNSKNVLPIRYQWFYAGTFFWISSGKLKQYIINNGIEIPKLSDRYYDEEFLGQIMEYDSSFPYVGSHDGMFILAPYDNYYLYADFYIRLITNNIDEFYGFCKKIIPHFLEPKVYLCTMAKHENEYLKDFCEHYLNLGFTHIHILDDNERDYPSILDIEYIKDKVDEGIISVEDISNMPYPKQNETYGPYYNTHKNEFDWCCFFDVDEYLVLHKHNTIQEYFLDENLKLNESNVVQISWVIYNDNGNVYKTDQPVFDRFTTVSKIMNEKDTIETKFFIKGKINDEIETFNGHTVRFLNNPTITKHNNGKIIDNFTPIHIFNNEYAQLNHYYTKSTEEYVEKRLKNFPSYVPEYFYTLEHYYGNYWSCNDWSEEKGNFLEKHKDDFLKLAHHVLN